MKILSTKKPIDLFCEASNLLNEAVIHTLGPKGTNTAIQNEKGMYEIINDGKAIIEKLTSLEPDIAPAMETLKQAAFETNRKAGDRNNINNSNNECIITRSKNLFRRA